MSCRAILHGTNEESIPLLLVRSGQLTPRQCDHEFKGSTGECPTCAAMIARADLGGGGSFAAAMQKLKDRGQNVSYKKFAYGFDGAVEPWRVCYWGHPPGYWDGIQFRDCQNAATNAHSVHLAVIKKHYEKNFCPSKGYKVKVEERLRRPGDPPKPYSPDLAIYGPNGERLIAVEYQRSYESYEKFHDRDSLRRAEKWPAVDWWFDDTQPKPGVEKATVYIKSQEHRTHLALLKANFFRCWVDHNTLVLQAEQGRCGELPPARKKRIEKKIERASLSECSTYRAVKLLEGEPEAKTIKEYIEPYIARRGTELNFRNLFDYSLEREHALAKAVATRQKRLEEQDRVHREWATKQENALKTQLQVRQINTKKEIVKEQESLIYTADEKDVRNCIKRVENVEQVGWSEPYRNGYRMAKNIMLGSLIRKNKYCPWLSYEGITSIGFMVDGKEYLSIDGWEVKVES